MFDQTDKDIRVVAYKDSGKFYALRGATLKLEHRKLVEDNMGFLLMDLIRNNDASVQIYSPMLNGFDTSDGMMYSVETDIDIGFCSFLLRKELL